MPPSAPDINEALFKALDTNNDGKLSRAELAAAPAVLRKLDIDDDEMITGQELAPGNGNYYGGVVAFTPDGRVANSNSSVTFWVKQPGSSTKELARQLLSRYGPKEKGKKKLTRKELGLDAKSFAQLDEDGDGFLDQEELAHFAQRPPDLELPASRAGNKRAQNQGRHRPGHGQHPSGFANEPRLRHGRPGNQQSPVLPVPVQGRRPGQQRLPGQE
jgi:hypothetical protein